MTQAEERAKLGRVALELVKRCQDPVCGLDERRKLLIRLGALREDGSAVPYFAEVFGAGWDKPYRLA